MTFRPLVSLLAIICAVLLLLGIEFQWPPFLFHCEGFGCSAMGAVYLMLAAVIVAAFTLGGALFGPRPRVAAAVFAGGMATLAMVAALTSLRIQAQRQVASGIAAHEATCAQYPKLCPEKAMSPQTPH